MTTEVPHFEPLSADEALAGGVIKPGFTFTHLSMLEPDWKPGEGERYRDAPRAHMVVTSVRQGTVFYTYDGDTKGQWWMPLADFEERYGDHQA